MDFRPWATKSWILGLEMALLSGPEALCANQRPLAEQLPKLRMKLVKKPEVLLDMAPSTVLPLRPLVEASSPRWPRGAPLAVRLAEYRAMHRRAVREGLQSGQRVLATRAGRIQKHADIVYICLLYIII